MKRLLPILPALSVLAWTVPAMAGGYDTPMLYSARHMGMGGAAVGYVSDPSALFHNPAGLGQVHTASMIGDFSLLVGDIQGTPNRQLASRDDANSITSDTTIAPFFLVGGAYRITDWLVAGLAVYPVASAGATFNYNNSGRQFEDHTKLVFLEISPGFAINLPHNIRIGAGYRINYTNLTRFQGPVNADEGLPVLDLDLKGFNFFSFRVGAQWQPVPELQLGLTYRHQTRTEVTSDSGVALTFPGRDISAEFTLPGKLAFGVRGQIDQLGIAMDIEYTLNSQNEQTVIAGTRLDEDGNDAGDVMAAQIFDWDDSVTLRGGLEYAIPVAPGRTISPRVGYVFDGRTSQKAYPTAFGTPPSPTHVITAGCGYDGGPYQINLAYAYRFGSVDIAEEEIGTDPPCILCSGYGSYAIALHGIYLDLSYDFE